MLALLLAGVLAGGAASEFRKAADEVLPETESYQLAVFSGGVSGIPRGPVIDRICAPPLVALLGHEISIGEWRSPKVAVGSAPGGFWQPGTLTWSGDAGGLRLDVEQVALRRPQGFVLAYTLRNPGQAERRVRFVSTQAPAIIRPATWGYGPHYGAIKASDAAPATGGGELAVHVNANGAVVYGLAGAAFSSDGAASSLAREIQVPAGGSVTMRVVLVVDEQEAEAVAAARTLLRDPAAAAGRSQQEMDAEIAALFARLPAFTHPDPRVVRYYRHSAVQLLFARWRLPGKLALDPWYATLGLDSGGLNTYMWGVHYVRVPLALFEPQALRAQLLAFLAAPLSDHYSIEPIHGSGVGPFYSYNPYSYVSLVDYYLRVTGDYTLLDEVGAGKSVRQWLVEMAEFGERDRDPDGNHLLDYGDDHNLLEIKTTGSGPGYIHEVPSPNGERFYCYRTVARILRKADYGKAADQVARALNTILWMEGPGWYGTRQKDGSVAPIWSIQVFDLLRFPGLVPPDRARRLVAHLNDDEFLGPWGIRSLSRRDRLWDWRDHDWSGPMTYIGDSPQLVADLFEAGFPEEAWKSFERILWWPEHLAIWPQGIANDDYSPRVPASARFGGRISAGRINEMGGATGVEVIVRGMFGVEPGLDGSIRFGACARGPATLVYPHRGRLWNIAQDAGGMEVRRDDGLTVALRKPGAWLRFLPDGAVEAWTAAGGAGTVSVTSSRGRKLHQVADLSTPTLIPTLR